MPFNQKQLSSPGTFAPTLGIFAPAMEYMVDAAQRSVLFWDVMRQRGNQYREHLAGTVPNVLDYEVELILSGKTLDRQIKYGLVKVFPAPGIKTDPTRRPFVIVAPRARQEPHALQRRTAGRQLVDRAHQRSRPRQVRRRLAGAEFREPEPREHAVDQAVQPLFQDRHRGAALSGLRALVGRSRQPERRGDP